jgi:hypothetical protein
MKSNGSDKGTGLFAPLGIWHDPGWYGLTMPIIKEIQRYNKENPKDKISVTQIKQISGRLEIYTTKRPDYINKMILKAGYESIKTCELCGAKGKLRDMHGSYKTLCDEHNKAFIQASKKDISSNELYKELINLDKYCCKKHKTKKYIKYLQEI